MKHFELPVTKLMPNNLRLQNIAFKMSIYIICDPLKLRKTRFHARRYAHCIDRTKSPGTISPASRINSNCLLFKTTIYIIF